MLKELYDYAISHKLVSRPGFKDKLVDVFISIDSSGKFLSIDPGSKEVKYFLPEIATNGNFSNIVAEKAEIVFNVPVEGVSPDDRKQIIRNSKVKFFRDGFINGKVYEPMFDSCLLFMEDQDECVKACEEFKRNKYKSSNVVSFKVDGYPITMSEKYYDWWDIYRGEISGENKKNNSERRCFITGDLCTPEKTVKKVSGLLQVGGHTSGDSLICFDKPAFTSYGFEQAENATVSPAAMATVNKALSDLLTTEKSFRIGGIKIIHWYKEPVEKEYDLVNMLDFRFDTNDDNEDNSDEAENESKEKEESALATAKRLLNSYKEGENPIRSDNRYYIILLSGNNGRIMIRNYDEGSYGELYKNFKIWFDDLSLISKDGELKPPKLFALYTRLLKKQKSNRDIGKRIRDELSGLNERILYSIFHGTPLPETVAIRALQYIRSDMYEGVDMPDSTACRLLKLWLIRKKKKNGDECELTKELNKKYRNNAYQTGRLIAVFAKLQKEALGDVGAGVVERYYAAASTTPALVIGRLTQLSQHHLSKLKDGSKIYYNNLLQSIYSEIVGKIPATLTLEEQSEFAIGYYQQASQLYTPKNNTKEEVR